jgi:hypothetical protein
MDLINAQKIKRIKITDKTFSVTNRRLEVLSFGLGARGFIAIRVSVRIGLLLSHTSGRHMAV